ncbi:hypothetical protein FGO68_gene12115 [Halteria grandinella]|uniref:Uncharacterized protein n=1 Tax=Halteria grandinella TaxID=5974 RepID=A0A8J8NDI6_HALGN|nr:hypothetical protein FGO68_gene12115 [Halteria grandinella]
MLQILNFLVIASLLASLSLATQLFNLYPNIGRDSAKPHVNDIYGNRINQCGCVKKLKGNHLKFHGSFKQQANMTQGTEPLKNQESLSSKLISLQISTPLCLSIQLPMP